MKQTNTINFSQNAIETIEPTLETINKLTQEILNLNSQLEVFIKGFASAQNIPDGAVLKLSQDGKQLLVFEKEIEEQEEPTKSKTKKK